MGKILIDLRNTTEEAASVAELKNNQDQQSTVSKNGKEETEHHPKPHARSKEETEYHLKPHARTEEPRRTSFTSEKSMDQDDDDDKETKYRLDPKYEKILWLPSVG